MRHSKRQRASKQFNFYPVGEILRGNFFAGSLTFLKVCVIISQLEIFTNGVFVHGA